MNTKEQLKPGQKPWTLDDVRQILDGKEADSKRLYTQDRKGLSPVAFAAMKAAATADLLTPLLELLEPPTGDEADKIDQIISLLQQIAEGQASLSKRMLALESKVSGCDVRSLGKPIARIVRVSSKNR